MTAVSSTSTAPVLTRVAVPWASRVESGAPGLAAELKSSVPASESVKAQAQPADSPDTVAAASPAKALSKAELASQVQELQLKMDKLNPALAFVVDQDSGRALIQLTDRSTKEIILQFPSQAALQISKALDRFEKGQLISRTV